MQRVRTAKVRRLGNDRQGIGGPGVLDHLLDALPSRHRLWCMHVETIQSCTHSYCYKLYTQLVAA